MTGISITEVRISRCKVFNRNDQNFKKVSNKKSPTRRADGGYRQGAGPGPGQDKAESPCILCGF